MLGIGKTTLTKKIYSALRQTGVEVRGFYTEEIREGGQRLGFDVVTLDGNRGPLARLQDKERFCPHLFTSATSQSVNIFCISIIYICGNGTST